MHRGRPSKGPRRRIAGAVIQKGCSKGSWAGHVKGGPPRFGRGRPHRAAVLLGDLLHDGQPQSHAVHAPGRVAALKLAEDPVGVLLGDVRAVVDHREVDVVVRFLAVHLNLAQPLASVLQCVLHEIAQDPQQADAVRSNLRKALGLGPADLPEVELAGELLPDHLQDLLERQALHLELPSLGGDVYVDLGDQIGDVLGRLQDLAAVGLAQLPELAGACLVQASGQPVDPHGGALEVVGDGVGELLEALRVVDYDPDMRGLMVAALSKRGPHALQEASTGTEASILPGGVPETGMVSRASP